MSHHTLQTIGDHIRYAASRFEAAGLHYGHGTDNAIDEAAALVLGILHMPPDLAAGWFTCRVTDDERETLLAAIAERIDKRRPVPYILGEGWFCGLSFEVDESVLIPRSPIAELIEQGFSPWIDPARVERIADVGTGCGCIAVACALAFPQAEVFALDNAAGALAHAPHNARRHGVSGRLRVQRSDLLEGLGQAGAMDLIVANPPYVDTRAMTTLPPEYRHEPREALAAGPDGMDVVRRLLPQAARCLAPAGWLVCEVGHGMAAFEAAFPEVPVTWVDLERGGEGVFVIQGEALQSALGADAAMVGDGVA